METPFVPLAVWPLAGLDPILIAIAVTLGWKADQFGKVFVAAIAALGLSVLAAWAITAIGLPWPAPIGRNLPMLLPVRTVAAFLWAGAAYGARHVVGRRRA